MKSVRFAIFVVFGSSLTVVHAGLPESYGFGARMIGMSGAGAALVNDWTSPYYNMSGLASPIPDREFAEVKPAGPVPLPKPSEEVGALNEHGSPRSEKTKSKARHFIGLGGTYIYPAMQLSLENGSALANANAAAGVEELKYAALNLGLVFDVRSLMKTPFDIPIKLGVAAALNADGSLTKVTDISQKSYNFMKLGRNPQRLSMMFGGAFQLWKDRLSVGGGLTNLAKGTGNTDLRNISLNPNNPPESETKLNVNGFSAPIAGITYVQPIGKKQFLAFSATYRGEIYLMTDLNVTAELPLGVISTTKTTVISSYDPAVIGGSIAFGFGGHRIAIDAEYQQWSRFKQPDQRLRYEIPAQFKDILVVRGGAEFQLNLFKSMMTLVRTGYAFMPHMTKDQNETTNYLDNTKHIISLGFGLIFPSNSILYGNTLVDFGFQYQLWQTRTTKKTVQDPIPDGTFQPDYSYGGNVFISGLSVTFQF
jgi:hypothetical protein